MTTQCRFLAAPAASFGMTTEALRSAHEMLLLRSAAKQRCQLDARDPSLRPG